MITTDFSDLIAERLRLHHRELATRWFERLLPLLPVDARDIFPTDSLLDHIPALILEISAYLREPNIDAIAANTAILDKARELGTLRHEQRASLHQVLREYQILGGVLVSFVVEEMERLPIVPPARESALLISRLHESVTILSQATVETFISLYTTTISEQTSRLEEFTRMAAHEWRQPLGALQFGLSLLRRADVDPDRALRTWDAVERNVSHLVDLTRKLEAVARMHGAEDNAVVQEVALGRIVNEAARQFRDMADARGVEIVIAPDLPTITIDVGRLELTLVNLLSNAIKYSDPDKAERRVAVSGGDDGPGWCRITVRDNGVGIPADALSTVFQRFTRAHAERDDQAPIAGLGLGLAIVDDSIRAIGGQVGVTSVEGQETVFTLRLPITPRGPAPTRPKP